MFGGNGTLEGERKGKERELWAPTPLCKKIENTPHQTRYQADTCFNESD